MSQSGSTSGSGPLLSDLQRGVLTLTLNRPESLNAADDALLLGLLSALREAEADERVRVVVLTGAGRGFCAGADLGMMAGAEEDADPGRFSRHLEQTFNPLVRAMTTLSRPVIAAVNGVAAGAGASLTLAADLRLWSSEASAAFVFSSIGLVPDAGSSWLLPRLVGYQRAFELTALAERVGAQDALRLGLCEQVFPAAGFMDEVQAYAERLAARPLTALALGKEALRGATSGTLDEALSREAALQDRAGASWEHREGVAAFRERRPADFLRRPE